MTRGRAISLVALLALANLGWWAWQSWYAPPERGSVPWRAPGAEDAKPAPATPGLATVRLAGEAAADAGAAPPAAATPAAVAAPTSADAPAAAATAAPAVATPVCLEIGPFTALVDSAAAESELQQRGYASRLAYAPDVVPQRYLVRIDGLPTAADQARVLARLRAAGLGDVAALPAERAVSLGLFSEAARATARVQQARAVGFAPRIAPQYPSDAEHWLRVDLVAPSPPGTTPARALGGAWRVQPCAVTP
jgi:hypothetical protein